MLPLCHLSSLKEIMPSKKLPAHEESDSLDSHEISHLQTSEVEKQSLDEAPKKSTLVGFLIQFLIIAVLFFSIGFVAGQKKIEITKRGLVPKIEVANQASSSNQNVDFSLFWQVFNTLPQKYIDKEAINGQKMLYGAISGMVRSLGDPYTAFVDPKQNEFIESDLAGSYEGVGIQIGFDKDKRLAVIAPLKGTPAEKAGILAKDLILKIAKKDAFDLTLPEAVELIRGPAGSKVKLTLLREGQTEPIEVEIERVKIDIKSVEVEYKEVRTKQVAVVKVLRFGEKTDSEWDAVVDEVNSKKVGGVIVDMRNNPGGLLESAIHLGGDFVTGTVVKQQSSDGSIATVPGSGRGRLLKVPTVVLVNGGSASAAEIFAGAIQDNGRGKVIGEQTFGKGTVQDVVNLPGGSSLHVTIAKWLTPKGHSIHDVGITPDTEVKITEDDRKNGKDPQLEKALEII